MAELKPKRGFVNAKWYAQDQILSVWPDYDDISPVPVLVIPDPDRDPTPEEIEALAQQMYAHTLPTATLEFGAVRPWEQANDGFRRVWRSIAAQAFRLGARVPS